MPHQYNPADSGMLSSRQLGISQYLMAQLVKTRVSMVWKMTWAAAICLLFSILNPALLQSSQQIQRMPQKCWCCQAIMYMKMAKGSIMQQLRPAAIHPRQTGRLPTTDPTIVFHSEVVFIRVYTNRQPPQMQPPRIAVIGLQLQSPPIPARPKPMPLSRAQIGGMPSTKGRWQVRCIFRSYSTSMYWLSAWVDMERATEDAKSGRADREVAQRLQEATVTMPLRTESLNFVSSLYLRRKRARPPSNNLLICYKSIHNTNIHIFISVYSLPVFLGASIKKKELNQKKNHCFQQPLINQQ